MKIKRMNKKVKLLWVRALRSGRYRKATGQLKKDNCFCCLGVLTDLWRYEAKPDWDGGCVPSIQADSEVLPEPVMKWAGLTESNPEVKIEDRKYGLAGLNDDGTCESGYVPLSFRKIADLIEKQL